MTSADIWPEISPSKERDAYFLAGQAVIALRVSLEVVQVSIQDPGASWIDVTYPDLSQCGLSESQCGLSEFARAHNDAKAVIRALLAGPAAQSRYSFGTYPPDCPLPDFDLTDREMLEDEAVWRAIALATKISNDSPSLIRSLWRETNGLIQGDEIWPAIEGVAQSLLINGELAGSEVKEIIRHALRANGDIRS